jgi:hypothetical protein
VCAACAGRVFGVCDVCARVRAVLVRVFGVRVFACVCVRVAGWYGDPLCVFVCVVGRYGDPLDPRGDLRSMATLLQRHMRPGGLLFLAVPTGRDRLVFNLHRVYGYV